MPDAARRRFQTKFPAIIFSIFYGFIFLLLFGTAFNSHAPDLGRIASGLGAVIVAVSLMLAWRAGMSVSPDGIFVRTYWGRQTHIPWSEVAGFELASNFNGGSYIALRRSDGHLLKTQGLATGYNTKRATQLIDQLEAERPGAAPS